MLKLKGSIGSCCADCQCGMPMVHTKILRMSVSTSLIPDGQWGHIISYCEHVSRISSWRNVEPQT